jgi:hypothetical protein
LKLVGVSFLLSLPFFITQLAALKMGPWPKLWVIAEIGDFAAGQVAAGVVALAVLQALNNRSVDMEESFLSAFSRAIPTVASAIVVVVAVSLGFALLVVPGVFALVTLCVVVPVVVVEEAGVWDAFERSIELTRGHRVQIGVLYVFIVIVMVLGFLLFGCLGGGLVFMFGSPDSGLSEAQTGSYGSSILLQAFWACVFSMGTSFHATVMAVLYSRLRELEDGTGVDDLLDVFR